MIRPGKKLSLQSRFRVLGFGFRVSQFETNFNSRFRVSGFGFRSSKPTLTVGFGFWVSVFGFRVSIGPGEVKSSESVSGFGFRVSIGPGEGKSSESVSGFGFRVSIGPGEVKSSVSGFGFRSSKPTLTVRVSGFAGRNQLCRPLSGSRLFQVYPLGTFLLDPLTTIFQLQKLLSIMHAAGRLIVRILVHGKTVHDDVTVVTLQMLWALCEHGSLDCRVWHQVRSP